jgi:hypothetical protein
MTRRTLNLLTASSLFLGFSLSSSAIAGKDNNKYVLSAAEKNDRRQKQGKGSSYSLQINTLHQFSSILLHAFDDYLTSEGIGRITIEQLGITASGRPRLMIPLEKLMSMTRSESPTSLISVYTQTSEFVWSISQGELNHKCEIIHEALKRAGFQESAILLKISPEKNVDLDISDDYGALLQIDEKIFAKDAGDLRALMSDIVKRCKDAKGMSGTKIALHRDIAFLHRVDGVNQPHLAVG